MRIANFVGVLATLVTIQASAEQAKPVVVDQNLADALVALKSQSPGLGHRILLSVPEIADSGAVFRIKITSTIPATDWIALFDSKVADPVASKFYTSTIGDATLLAEIKLNKTTRLRAIVRAGGKFYEVSKEVKTTLMDCHD